MAKYKLLLERLPDFIPIGLMIFLIIITAVLGVLSTSFENDVFHTIALKSDLQMDFRSYLRGETFITSVPLPASIWKQELYFWTLWDVDKEWLDRTVADSWSIILEVNIHLVGCYNENDCNVDFTLTAPTVENSDSDSGSLNLNVLSGVESQSNNSVKHFPVDTVAKAQIKVATSAVSLTDPNSIYPRLLKCYKNYNWSKRKIHNILAGFFTTSGIRSQMTHPVHCDPIMLYQESPIQYPFYRIAIRMRTPSILLESRMRMYHPEFDYGYSSYDEKFTFMQTASSYIFAFITLIFLLIFLLTILVIRKQYYFQWHLQQRFIIVILVLQFFYNNPLGFLRFLGNFQVHILIHFCASLWKASYLSFIVFAVLVSLGRFYTPTNEMSVQFYVPKALLAVTMWIACLSSYIYSGPSLERLVNADNFSIWNSSLYTWFEEKCLVYSYWFLMVLLCLYFALQFYMFIQIIWREQKNRFTLSFKIVVMASSFLLSFLLTCVILSEIFLNVMQSFRTLSFTFLINLTTLILGFLYLPSGKPNDVHLHELVDDSVSK